MKVYVLVETSYVDGVKSLDTIEVFDLKEKAQEVLKKRYEELSKNVDNSEYLNCSDFDTDYYSIIIIGQTTYGGYILEKEIM